MCAIAKWLKKAGILLVVAVGIGLAAWGVRAVFWPTQTSVSTEPVEDEQFESFQLPPGLTLDGNHQGVMITYGGGNPVSLSFSSTFRLHCYVTAEISGHLTEGSLRHPLPITLCQPNQVWYSPSQEEMRGSYHIVISQIIEPDS